MKRILSLVFVVAIVACQPAKKEENTIQEEPQEVNPAAEGFNKQASDTKAMEIADEVMQAMGGRTAWDSLRYLSWNFFGARDLVWDKQTGRVRIDFPGDTAIYLVNVKSMEGKVMKNGSEINDVETLEQYKQKAKSIWINDSYWLVMPFKLKDSGVTLKYIREDTTQAGATADVLQLTFENVGDTPHNKYEVFVDQSDRLIKQWSYYKDATQDSASAIWPWDNYQNYNGLMLSGDRSDSKGPKNIKVFDELPDSVFENFEVPTL